MFMVTNKPTKEDLFTRGETLSFPESVKGMLRGDLGQPDGGWPKGTATDRPERRAAVHRPSECPPPPVDFEKRIETFQKQYDNYQGIRDFLSRNSSESIRRVLPLPKQYGDVSSPPTGNFFTA